MKEIPSGQNIEYCRDSFKHEFFNSAFFENDIKFCKNCGSMKYKNVLSNIKCRIFALNRN
jgi:hypothetical protein